MSDSLRLIVGLGNPGTRYQNTWHNLGWMTVQALAQRRNAIFKPGKSSFIYAETDYTTLMLPTGYMNRSGEAVGWWLRYYKVEPAQILTVLDDHDLLLGRLRLRLEGSSGGHRGLDDIIRVIGTDQFPRLRLGIAGDKAVEDLADYVLSPIPKSMAERVQRIIAAAVDALELVEKSGPAAAMNTFNRMVIDE
ncbi:MAG: aminoacyl-tRNA hydrolase [Calditrichaeota bacterium]|nr:aminoacyl-tRNA hydrolase [Calditrichota bacterium]